jgi:hypothetical protein
VGGEQVCWLADKQIMQKESVRRLIRKLKQNGVSPLTDKQRVQSLSVVDGRLWRKAVFVPKPHVVMKQGMSNRQHITDIPISVIAQQLGVRYVLGGSVRALGGQIRLAAQLAES